MYKQKYQDVKSFSNRTGNSQFDAADSRLRGNDGKVRKRGRMGFLPSVGMTENKGMTGRSRTAMAENEGMRFLPRNAAGSE